MREAKLGKQSNRKNYKHSFETKEKLRNAHKKNPRKISESHQEKLKEGREKFKTTQAYEEMKKKSSESKKGEKNPMFGKEPSASHKKKIGDSLRGRKYTTFVSKMSEEEQYAFYFQKERRTKQMQKELRKIKKAIKNA